MPVLPFDTADRRAQEGAPSGTARPPIHANPSWFTALLRKCGDGDIPGLQLSIDGTILLLSFLTAYLVRYDGEFAHAHVGQLLFWAPILVGVRLLSIFTLGVHRFLWKFVCLRDIAAISRSLLWVTGALLLLRWLYPSGAACAYWLRLPLGIIVPEFLLSLGGLVTIRGMARLALERNDRDAGDAGQPSKRVLLYGAGRAGVMLAHELERHGGILVAGFVDDDRRKLKNVIAGLPVLGSGTMLSALVRQYNINEVMISIATPPPGVVSRILSECRAIAVKTTIVPSAQEIISGQVKISRVREIRIEDLLGRSSAAPGDCSLQVRAAYQGKRVLVTGAGGSIGSELCRQILLLQPTALAILDKDENSIYELEHELRFSNTQVSVVPCIGDIKCAERIRAVFEEFCPQVVVHAAAHKHVPLMEQQPCEAVLNNVLGMKNLLDSCRAKSVERFVFISSDKAVNPTNVMGATKRIGEKLLQVCTSGTQVKAASVRFGNVMGSRGSVIPLFKRQIEQGGPVTVTHPDILRFFMTIPEAVHLVLCAGSLATNRETFVLDMGEPRRVLDLARKMIELAGLRPDRDIPIQITGLRPGEKMEEELACIDESVRPTQFEKVFEIPRTTFDEEVFRRRLDALIQAARAGNTLALINILLSMDLGYHLVPASVPSLAVDRVPYAS